MKKNKIIIIVIFLLLTILLGVSYAFYDYYQVSSKSHQLLTGNIYVNYIEGNTVSLVNVFPMSKEKALARDDNYINFTIQGKNTHSKKDVYYEIVLNYGDDVANRKRLNDKDIKFRLVKEVNGEEIVLIDEASYDNINNQSIFHDIIARSIVDETIYNFKLIMWIDENVTIGSDTDETVTYSQSVYSNSYISIRVDVIGEMRQGLYGVRRLLSSTSTEWERLGDGVNRIVNAQIGTNSVINDFDNIYPWSDIKSYNFNYTTKQITAWYGDSNFKYDGSNGLVMTYIPEFYYKRIQDSNYEYVYISRVPFEGSIKSEAFSVGRYLMSDSGYSGRSASNSNPRTGTLSSMRTYANRLGTEFSQMDYHYFILQLLYLVEYADYDAQDKLGLGISNYNYDATNHKALISETGVNRIIVADNSFIVGQKVHLGTALNKTDVTTYRTITAINDYNENGIIGYEIVMDDGGGFFDTIVDSVVIYSCAQTTGSTDELKMKSGTMVNDGFHSVIYRGIEDFYGNTYQFIDGTNVRTDIVNGISLRRTYVNYNYLTYANEVFDGDYVGLSYTNATNSGWAVNIGYDSNNPLIAITTMTVNNRDISLNTYYRAYNDANRVMCAGESYYSGVGASPWSYHFNNYYGAVNIGARLVYQLG